MGQGMIPENKLSTIPKPSHYIGGRKLDVGNTIDYEDGGIDFNDISMGHLYQIWDCRIVNEEDIVIENQGIAPVTVYSGTAITEVSFTFDQNMRYTVAFVESGVAKLLWYDSSIPGETIDNIGIGITNPRVFLDDKRLLESSKNDIILGYMRGGNLCYRQQRDRYTIERILKENIGGHLVKIGMSRGLRVQFTMDI
jgi:hypothetical protein